MARPAAVPAAIDNDHVRVIHPERLPRASPPD
jgi:hypothetical protein